MYRKEQLKLKTTVALLYTTSLFANSGEFFIPKKHDLNENRDHSVEEFRLTYYLPENSLVIDIVFKDTK